MIKKSLVVLAIAGLIYIGANIQKPFWNEVRFQEETKEIQRNGDYVPYRLRKILFNQYLAIAKTETERTLDWLWLDKFWGILTISIFIALRKRRWVEMILMVIGVALMNIENNPNTSYYFWFLIPSICAIFL
ncbi:MAG: hypothetical protein UX30_C0003G0016 [Candidatus Saccharibacteria bacterium GW2011_GWA2_46_10]|nr:MAG: hypothetical protein UX30_C0003G0016 [Candidatus Saccharibacteria bacterium GW2011_GWA2_46_10]